MPDTSPSPELMQAFNSLMPASTPTNLPTPAEPLTEPLEAIQEAVRRLDSIHVELTACPDIVRVVIQNERKRLSSLLQEWHSQSKSERLEVLAKETAEKVFQAYYNDFTHDVPGIIQQALETVVVNHAAPAPVAAEAVSAPSPFKFEVGQEVKYKNSPDIYTIRTRCQGDTKGTYYELRSPNSLGVMAAREDELEPVP